MNPIATYMRRHKHFLASRLPHAQATFPAGSMPPQAVAKAYGFPANQGAPKATTVYGIGSLGGSIPGSDVTAYCAVKGYPTPNITTLPVGGVTVASDPGGANVENNLDWQRIVDAWYLAYPTIPCKIIFGVGPNSGTGIGQVTLALDGAGCTDINWSWGAPASDWAAADWTYTDNIFRTVRAKGKTISCASGDNSSNDGTSKPTVDLPCGSAYAWAVGGTALALAADGSRASEKAWGDGRPGDEGGGGGFNALAPIPPFQVGVVGGSVRGCPDNSCNADPNTGYQTYSDGAWGVVGGTSASSPTMCGLFGVLRAMGCDLSNYQAALYAARATAFNDITTGSNGYPSVVGWDAATGIGSPIGAGVLAALTGTTPPPPPPSVANVLTVTNATGLPVGNYTVIGGTTLDIGTLLQTGTYPVGAPPAPPPVTTGPTETQIVTAVNARYPLYERQLPWFRSIFEAVKADQDATIHGVYAAAPHGVFEPNIDWSKLAQDLLPVVLQILQTVLSQQGGLSPSAIIRMPTGNVPVDGGSGPIHSRQ